MEIGDPVPSFTLRSAAGVIVDDSALRSRVTVLLFVATRSRAAVALVERLSEAQRRLGDTLPEPQVIVLLLDRERGAEARLAALGPGGTQSWAAVSAPHAEVLDLAARFGAAVWSEDEHLEQVAAVAVIAPDASIAEIFRGLEAWSARDLVAALSAAGR